MSGRDGWMDKRMEKLGIRPGMVAPALRRLRWIKFQGRKE